MKVLKKIVLLVALCILTIIALETNVNAASASIKAENTKVTVRE